MSTESQETVQRLLAQVEAYTHSLQALPTAQRLDAATLDAIYAIAYQQLKQGRVDQAKRYFALLLVYAPTDARFLSGMAICSQVGGRNDDAIQLYSLALFIEPDSCQLAMALAESLVRHQAHDAARELLRLVVRLSQSPADAECRGRAELLLKALTLSMAGTAPLDVTTA